MPDQPWSESIDRIQDLMRSHHFTDEPVRNTVATSQWRALNVPLEVENLSRADVFDLAASARSSNTDEDLYSLFWHVMAWGIVGSFRNAAPMAREAQTPEGRDKIVKAMRRASTLSYAGELQEAYATFNTRLKVRQLGPAFFTKMIYFTGDRDSGRPRGLVLDDRVRGALFALTGQWYGAEGSKAAKSYDKYCREIHDQAEKASATVDAVENRLYRLGQLIENKRNVWLQAEVALYREGAESVTFDAIVEKVETTRHGRTGR